MPKCILIVDDSAGVRGLLRRFFDSQPGFEVCGEAVDGIEAISKTRELKPDLIILDLSMPRMNGLEAAAAIQEIVPDTPIILFTLHQGLISQKQANRVGIRSVISKTGLLDDLFREVQKLLSAA